MPGRDCHCQWLSLELGHGIVKLEEESTEFEAPLPFRGNSTARLDIEYVNIP